MLKLPSVICHNAVLRSYGQVFLQPSSRSGGLFILGIAVNSLSQCIVALIAILVGLLTARCLKVSTQEMTQGLYGYNAALLALATSHFFSITPVSLILIIAGSVITSFLMQKMLRHSATFPPLTAPFILTAWVLLMIGNSFELTQQVLPDNAEIDQFYTAVARGIGQVLFQDNALSGILCLAGLLSYSRLAAVWAVIGSASGVFFASLLSFPETLINNGSYSFNAVLAGIALASCFPRKFILPIIGISITILLTRVFQLVDLTSLTAPFVLASWLVIVISKQKLKS